MQPGSVVADRFEIEAFAGSGGMSQVYRALDRLSGERVALKLLRYQAAHASRFRREAELLSTLEHPGIVRYVAHAAATGNSPAYMAMEWLEGESLRDRLSRGALGIDESISLMRRVCLALGRAHALGIVHRDVKPENIFLVDARVNNVKVLDFGVALGADASRRMTVTGIPMGTVGYMSPEQVRADGNVDARADVFALGEVFFECLTGVPAFAAHHPLAVLAKIVCEPAPRVMDLRPSVPRELDALVARMLEKEREDRPSDANAVAEALSGLDANQHVEEQPPPRPSVGLGSGEQQVVTAVVGTTDPADSEDTLPIQAFHERDATLRAVVEKHGGRFDVLASAGFVALFSGRAAASDSALRAARCALALREIAGDTELAIVTGSTVTSERLPVAQVVDRAVDLIASPGSAGVRIDEATGGLLPPRFEVERVGAARRLLGERMGQTRERAPHGTRRPCFGREREIATLEAVLDECESEPVARVVLLTGALGIGKSRIVEELLSANARRERPFETWIGRADPLSAGTPFTLLADVLCSGLGVAPQDTDAQEKLEARVRLNVPAADAGRVAEFLAEPLGVPFDDADRVQLRAARADPTLMRDQILRAWVELLEHECQTRPLLVVLEDLHWGDRPSLELVDAVLRRAPELPLLVLGVARPEVHDVFPNLFAERAPQEVRVRDLPRRVALELVRTTLGDSVAQTDIERLVETAAGNALYLEELMRARAEGRFEPPESVLAMLRARLEGMEPEARRILRAASVYGRSFRSDAVSALVSDLDSSTFAQWLDVLTEREVLSRGGGSASRGVEYAFRQSLARDAAYGMLTDADRELGHRLAAAWLVAHGERDAALVAEHHEKGGLRGSSTPWWERAAASALGANALGEALDRVRRGVAAGAQGATLGGLSLTEGEVLRWTGELDGASRALGRALNLLPHGDPRWYHAAAERALVLQRLGQVEELERFARHLLGQSVRDEPSDPLAHALVRTALFLQLCGRAELAGRLLGAVSDLERARVVLEPATRAQRHVFLGLRALYRSDLGAYLREEQAAERCFEEAGDVRRALNESGSVGYAYMELGAYAEAEKALSEALSRAERIELLHVCAASRHNLGMVYARLGRFAEARAAESSALGVFRSQRDRRLEGAALAYTAHIELLAGELAAAEESAQSAIALVREAAPPILPLALTILGAALLGQGDADGACRMAEQAVGLIADGSAVEAGEALSRLTHAEALIARGRRDEARAALHAAHARLLERAGSIEDPALRASFLEKIPEHARTLELAAEFGAGPTS